MNSIKYFVLIWLALISTSALADSVKVRLVSGGGLVSKPVETVFILNKSRFPREKITCRTGAIPEHEIQIDAIRDLKPPFESQAIPSSCEQILVWGETRTCYDEEKYPQIAELIQWCSEI